MPTVINGLPAHVLLIHIVVVLVPLGALFTVLSAAWPGAHRKLGFISPLTCLIALIFVPITTHAGEWLQNRLDPEHRDPVIDRHANLGHTFVWFAIGLFVVSAAVWWFGRQYEIGIVGRRKRDTLDETATGVAGTTTRLEQKALASTTVSVVVLVVALAMSVAAVWQLYRIGDSGAHAVWDGRTG